jgi:hypothetical protein
VGWWYRQNLLLYGTEDTMHGLGLRGTTPRALASSELVDALCWNLLEAQREPSGREGLRAIMGAVRRKVS